MGINLGMRHGDGERRVGGECGVVTMRPLRSAEEVDKERICRMLKGVTTHQGVMDSLGTPMARTAVRNAHWDAV